MIKFGFFLLTVAVVLLGGCETTSVHHPEEGRPATSAAAPQALKPRALEVLRASLRNENPYVRNHAIEVVVETGQKEMMSEIIRLMGDTAIPVRFSATAAAGDMQCFGCEQPIRERLKDDDANVRLAAAYSMIQLNNPEYHADLRRAADHADQTVRANALLLLGKNGDRDDLDLLYRAMRDDTASEKVKIQAIDSIAQLKDARLYRNKLWALLISKYADDRVMGIRGMGALGTLDAHNAIITMLTDDVPEVRLCAAEQLGRLGDTTGREEVAQYLRNHADLSRGDVATMLAVMAIGRIGTPELIDWLPKALDSQSDVIRLTAAQSVLLLAK